MVFTQAEVKYVRRIQRQLQDHQDKNISFSTAVRYIIGEHKQYED